MVATVGWAGGTISMVPAGIQAEEKAWALENGI